MFSSNKKGNRTNYKKTKPGVMINKADHDLIDRYIKGQLSEKEIEVFNGKLENNGVKL
jgi:hypothetical protein